MDEIDMIEPRSECCDARPVGDMVEYGLCGRCKDHTSFYEAHEDGAEEKKGFFGCFTDKQEEIIARIKAEAEEQ